jgi:HSP20 family protein
MTSDPTRHPSPYSQPSGELASQFSIDASPSSDPAGQQPEAQIAAVAPDPAAGYAGGQVWVPSPAIDVIENSDEIWVFLDLPGFQPDEVQLEGDARTLHVSASRPSKVEEGRQVLTHERTVQIDRTIQLPVTVDIEEAEAIFERGVCKLTIPKAANERYRDIEIRTAE